MNKTIIRNIGKIVTGDCNNPILHGDTICVEGSKISFIGAEKDAPKAGYTVNVDANGLTVCSGIIDAHAHPPLSNYLSNFKAYDWVDNYAAAGVTSLVSVGSIRFSGAAKDARSAMLQAMCAKNIWDNYHPSFVKVHANAVMLHKGMTESDFIQLASNGVNVVGEIGMSEVQDPAEASELVRMAKKHGFVTTLHCGGPSSPDCASYTLEEIEQIAPDVLCHVNGAPTPLREDWLKELVQSGKYWFDCVSNGSETLLVKIAGWAAEAGTYNKMMLGTNVPSMSGFSPMGLWIQMTAISQNVELPPEKVFSMASGNVTKCYGLDHGIIAEGQIADLLFVSTGSIMPDMLSTMVFGRVPSVAGTFINGAPGLEVCKNMAPPKKRPVYTSLV